MLTGSDLNDVKPENFKGKKLILNIFPSLDTATCAASVRKFNEKAASIKDSVVLCISRDLPFAQQRFCVAEGIKNVVSLSEMRGMSFGKRYGIELSDGPLAGLFARAVIVTDADHKIVYTELVPEIAKEPDYEKALNAVG